MPEISTPGPRNVVLLPVAGEVDIASIDDLLTAAHRCLDGRPAVLEIDLAEVTFIDSSGLGALVRIRNEASGLGVQVVLVRLPRAVSRLMEISGLEKVFEIRPGL